MSRTADRLNEAIVRAMETAAALVDREIQFNLNGRVLNRRTGQLAGSIRNATYKLSQIVVTEFSTHVVHGRIWEVEGIRRGMRVVPPRPFIQPAIDAELETIKDLVAEAGVDEAALHFSRNIERKAG